MGVSSACCHVAGPVPAGQWPDRPEECQAGRSGLVRLTRAAPSAQRLGGESCARRFNHWRCWPLRWALCRRWRCRHRRAPLGTTQISGSGYDDFAGTVCAPGPGRVRRLHTAGADRPLEGCRYTDVQGFKSPRGTLWGSTRRSVRALIVASLDGGPVGTFTTTYRFESKWDPDAGDRHGGQGPLPAPDHGRVRDRRVRRGRRDGWTSRTRSATGLFFCYRGTHHARLRQAQHRPRSVTTTRRGKPPRHHLHRVANALTCR